VALEVASAHAMPAARPGPAGGGGGAGTLFVVGLTLPPLASLGRQPAVAAAAAAATARVEVAVGGGGEPARFDFQYH
jgi:hypothetical protein